MGKRVAAIAALAIAITSPAKAEWYKAESPHFVVYADDKERDVVKFAEMLERYHQAIRYITKSAETAPSPSNRVTIFAVGSESKVRELAGAKANSGLAGFYSPRAGGSVAFVPDIRASTGTPHFSLIVLLHEYAHHFIMSSSAIAMPKWWNEGAAEFFASAKFERDGGITIGAPANHRAGELAYAQNVTVAQLLDRKLYEKAAGAEFDAFYVRAWALYHMLVFSPERRGQLATYANAFVQGKSEQEAARLAFGDLKALQKDLDAYVKQRRMYAFTLGPDRLAAAPVRVTALSAGEAAAMPLRIRSQSGVNAQQAKDVVTELRKVAARYPQDAGVLTALAEAEYDAGNPDAAIVAADAAIALDPSRTNAYVQKGYALFSKAGDAPDGERAAAWQEAVKPFQALNKIENDHPLPLIYFYRSYAERGAEPTELARHALERASQLAPFDQGLRLQTAVMQAREGKITLAVAGLNALAANPHGGQISVMAQKLGTALEKLPDGTKWTGSMEAVEKNVASAPGDAGDTANKPERDGE